jgi:alpha-L-fucosidase
LFLLLGIGLGKAMAVAAPPGLDNPFFVFDNGLRSLAEPSQVLKQLGYAGMGASGFEVAGLVRQYQRAGLRVFSTYVPCRLDRTPAYDAGQFKRCIAELKGSGVLLWLTVIGGKSGQEDEKAVSAVRGIADLAAAGGLRVALYPHTGFYVATTGDALRIAKRVQRKNLGVSINLCHELMTDQGPRLEATIREAMPSLFMVSINGADQKQPGYKWDRLIQPLGRGTYDVCGFLGKLKAAGYSGPIGLQCYAVKGDPMENLRISMQAWRDYAARLACVETPVQRDTRMQWWREARFGMFVHWGLYSGLAGTWQGKPVGKTGGMEWIQQRVKVDTDTYAKQAIPRFQPRPGFAHAWAKLAKEAGCRYVVFTTKHHEGFALHNSKVSTYDAGSVLNRDLVREIVDALRAEGLRVGFYHSVIDWHHDQYAYVRSKQLPHPLKGKPYPNGQRDHAKYIDYLHGEVRELTANYGPVDVLWWDYSSEDFQGQEAWRAFDLMAAVRAAQPGIIMNNRLFRVPEGGFNGMGTNSITARMDSKYGDFVTPEQHIPATGMPGVDWETCMTLNTTWGYSEHDHAWKSDETLIRNLIDIASKGGNYLLNIGPKGDGSVPEESVRSMQAVGAWMKQNGESIYATAPSPFAKLAWGRATQKKLAGGKTRLYLHVFDWPADGRLVVPLQTSKPAQARLLAGGRSLPATIKSNRLTIAVGPHALDKIATVIAVDLEGDWHVAGD